MSPVNTRSASSLRNRTAIKYSENTDENAPSSSEDDDEGIPHQSTTKASPYGATLRPSIERSLPAKRRRSHGSLVQVRESKRHKGGSNNDLDRADRPALSASKQTASYLTPPSPASNAVLAELHVAQSRASSAEDKVPRALLEKLNSSLRGTSKISNSETIPNAPLNLSLAHDIGTAVQEDNHTSDVAEDAAKILHHDAQPQEFAGVESNVGELEGSTGCEVNNEGVQAIPEEHDMPKCINHDTRSQPGYVNELDHPPSDAFLLQHEVAALPLSLSDADDHWNVPIDPRDEGAEQDHFGRTPKEWAHDGRQSPELHSSAQATLQDPDYQAESPSEALGHNSSQATEESENEYVDPEVDFDVPSDIDDIQDEASPSALFRRDLHKIRTFSAKYDGDSLLFIPSSISPSTTLSLSTEAIEQMHTLMGRHGWSGLQRGWEQKISKTEPTTRICKIMTHYLRKLGRFCEVCPKGLRLKDQNGFLKRHHDVLEHSAHFVEESIESILGKLSDRAKHNSKKRQAMASDLMAILIPSLIHVLEKVRLLGGLAMLDTSFTSSTIQLLTRLCDWIGRLYRPLLHELEDGSLEKKPKASNAQLLWERKLKARKKLEPLLTEVQNLLRQAPDQLKEAEDEMRRAEKKRLWILKRQEEEKIKWALEEKKKANYIKEQNALVVQHLRGKAKRQTPAVDLSRSTLSPRSVSTSLGHHARPVDWGEEAKECLSRKLKDVLPVLPQSPKDFAQLQPPLELPALREVAALVGYSERETMAKARDLLKQILIQNCRFAEGRDIQTWIQQALRRWR